MVLTRQRSNAHVSVEVWLRIYNHHSRHTVRAKQNHCKAALTFKVFRMFGESLPYLPAAHFSLICWRLCIEAPPPSCAQMVASLAATGEAPSPAAHPPLPLEPSLRVDRAAAAASLEMAAGLTGLPAPLDSCPPPAGSSAEGASLTSSERSAAGVPGNKPSLTETA